MKSWVEWSCFELTPVFSFTKSGNSNWYFLRKFSLIIKKEKMSELTLHCDWLLSCGRLFWDGWSLGHPCTRTANFHLMEAGKTVTVEGTVTGIGKTWFKMLSTVSCLHLFVYLCFNSNNIFYSDSKVFEILSSMTCPIRLTSLMRFSPTHLPKHSALSLSTPLERNNSLANYKVNGNLSFESIKLAISKLQYQQISELLQSIEL